MSNWTAKSPLAQAVYIAGFLYEPTQDIIYSRMDALQRHLGFAYSYDANALPANMVIDCEPIFFTAQGKMWMIELWKGQYGLETGGEIGIYNRPINPPPYYRLLDATVGIRPYDPTHGFFYQSASDADMLQMSYTLKRNGAPLFTRGPQKHWWLTGFKWGVYSTPDQLTMEVAISLPQSDMHSAFVRALQAMNYSYKDDGVTVSFDFAKPYAPQPWTNSPILAAVRTTQQQIVALYQAANLPNNDPNMIPGELAAKIEAAVLVNGPTTLGNVLTLSLRAAGQTAPKVAELIATELGVATDMVQGWITNAGYNIVQWVESVYASLRKVFTMNYSSAVEVHNVQVGAAYPSDLTRQSFHSEHGEFMVPPPAQIPAGSVGRFYLKDKLGARGSAGSATYSYIDAQSRLQTVTFAFGCPTGFSDNYAKCDRSDFAIYAKSGSDPHWGGQGAVPGRSHPLYAAYVWGRGPAPS